MKKVWLILLTLSASLISFAKDKVSFYAKPTDFGVKISAIILDYGDEVLSGSQMAQAYRINITDAESMKNILVHKAYTTNKAQPSDKAQAGNFVVLELAETQQPLLYRTITHESDPQIFKARSQAGAIIEVARVQAKRVPHLNDLTFEIQQQAIVKLSKGTDIPPHTLNISLSAEKVRIKFIDDFSEGSVSLGHPDNKLWYRLYKPQASGRSSTKYPLIIFLHGSGQRGFDNFAQLQSSKGATSILDYEESFVLAPQYAEVFDRFDFNDPQGIHWQSDNRATLVFAMIDKTLAQFPNIDPNRIYLIGLSRGAEGVINVLLKRPHFFAAALSMSTREAGSIQWIDGNATKSLLTPLKQTPIWFFHSSEDRIAPVAGTRKNVQLLKELGACHVKYTEFTFTHQGDNGIVSNNAHNTWESVFNSPVVMRWLLSQNLSNNRCDNEP